MKYICVPMLEVAPIFLVKINIKIIRIFFVNTHIFLISNKLNVIFISSQNFVT